MSLSELNAARWARAKIRPSRAATFSSVAKRLVGAKDRYLAVQRRTGVPWFVIAVIHEREASQSWSANLGQGDPWNRVSTHVPAGRGPFRSWEDAAVDALANCAPYAARWRNWTIGGTLELLERYNGLGYANKGVPSPYVWSGTDQYVSGKYIRDHVYDPNAVDQQLGCAGLLLAMKALDGSIALGAPAVAEPKTPPVVAPPKPVPAPVTPPAKPPAPEAVKHGLWAGVAATLALLGTWLTEHPIAAILVVAALVAILVFGWRWYRNRRKNEPTANVEANDAIVPDSVPDLIPSRPDLADRVGEAAVRRALRPRKVARRKRVKRHAKVNRKPRAKQGKRRHKS